MIGSGNLPYRLKETVVRHITKLEADFVLIDLGAGTAFNALDLFTLLNERVIVYNPESHSRMEAY